MEAVESIKRALKLIGEVDEFDKRQGLGLLATILDEKKLISYNELVFAELVKLAEFEEDCLQETWDIIERHFFSNNNHHDKLAEVLIYRVARSTRFDICKVCLEKLALLMDYFDESVAKHSKQILKLVDLNNMIDLNPILENILVKMKTRLPPRRTL